MAFVSLNLGNLIGFSYFHDVKGFYLKIKTLAVHFLPRASLYYRAGLRIVILTVSIAATE